MIVGTTPLSKLFHLAMLVAIGIIAAILSYATWQYNLSPYELKSVETTTPVVSRAGTLMIESVRSHHRFCNMKSNRYILRKSNGATVYADQVPTISSEIGENTRGHVEFKLPSSLEDDDYEFRVVVLSDCGLRVFSTGPMGFYFAVRSR